MDFTALHITQSEKRVLRRLKRKMPDGILANKLNATAVRRLYEHELIRVVEFHTGDLGCYLSNLGYDYWLYIKSVDHQRRRESIRYWITTAIAVAAFALSVIALLLELGVIQAP